jgi:tetratricopeptide (TPR) repeat protein
MLKTVSRRAPPKRTLLDQPLAINELRQIRKSLQPKVPKTWYEKSYATILTLAKYVGIPGLIIAAVGPSQKLATDLIDHQNKALIQRVYLDYVSQLIAEGSIDRANKLLGTLENQKDFDARLQYYKAKVLIAMAIQQARNYTEAFDTATILTEISAEKTLFFPSVGNTEDLIELSLALVDIDTAQQRYAQAREKLKAMENNKRFQKSAIFLPSVEYRLGSLDVLQYNISEAKAHLLRSLTLAKKEGQKLLVANATFQLAKANQFGGDHPSALVLYKEAAKTYESLPDKFGLLRSYNNIAMIQFDDGNNGEARENFNLEQVLAREVGDELGYARATVNIALVEKREKNYDAAIRLAMDALGVYKQQNNLLGITTAANVLSNSYSNIGNYPEAIAYAKQNFDASLQLRELRGVAASCGTLSNIYSDSGDDREMVFASLCAATLIRQLAITNLPGSGEDYRIFTSRIKRVTKTANDSDEVLSSAERRVQDVFLKLNLGMEGIHSEVAMLKGLSVDQPNDTRTTTDISKQ